jgi:hypothetical protein
MTLRRWMTLRRFLPLALITFLFVDIGFVAAALVLSMHQPTGKTPALQKIYGLVTWHQQPQADLWVRFAPCGGGRPSVARTDSTGRYELRYAKLDGALLGKHCVTIGSGGKTDERGNLLSDPITLLTQEVEVRPGVAELDFALTDMTDEAAHPDKFASDTRIAQEQMPH